LYISAAENQPRPARHALVQQRRYGNTTTLTADDKFSTTLPRGRAANATQQTDGTIEVPGCQEVAYLQGRCKIRPKLRDRARDQIIETEAKTRITILAFRPTETWPPVLVEIFNCIAVGNHVTW